MTAANTNGGVDATAILSMMVMKDNVRADHIIKVVKTLAVANIVQKVVPAVGRAIRDRFFSRIDKTMSILEKPTDPSEKFSSCIKLLRTYEDDDKKSGGSGGITAGSTTNTLFDALVEHISKIPETKYLKRMNNGVMVIDTQKPIPLSPSFWCQQESVTYTNDRLVGMTIKVYSYTADLPELQRYLTELENEFIVRRMNSLGDNIYLFDEIPVVLPMTQSGSYRFEMAPDHMAFKMAKLETNKSMKNIYGKSMRMVRNRVKFFLENKQWYMDEGFPWSLGILLYGAPGCGKTSLIKAISKDTRRHVFNLKLSKMTTTRQLENFFFDENVHVVLNGQTTSIRIPMEKRLIIIEDIDCISDIVKKRDSEPLKEKEVVKENAENADVELRSMTHVDWTHRLAMQTPPKQQMQMMDKMMRGGGWNNNAAHDDPYGNAIGGDSNGHPLQLTLSAILNILDGVLETQGRMIIMTTNHPENLDSALIRPGRVDVKVEFKRADREDILEMIQKVGKIKDIKLSDLEGVPEDKYTVAEVMERILNSYGQSKQDIIKTFL